MKKTLRNIVVFVLIAALAVGVAALGGCKKEEAKKDEPIILTFGEWSSQGYKNNPIGISFALPDGWSYMTKEEIAHLQGLSIEAAEDEAALLKTLSRCNIMMANGEMGSSVQIMTEDLAQTGKSELTAEEYLNERSAELCTFYSERDTDYKVSEVYDITVGSCTYKTVKFTVSSTHGSGLVQLHMVRKSDNYIINVVVSALSEEELEGIMKYFS